MIPTHYTITRVERTFDGNTWVEVRFNTGLINDFVFVNLPATYHGYKKDDQGRPFIYSPIQDYPIDIRKHVHNAVAMFANEVEEKGYKGDMRDPMFEFKFVQDSTHLHIKHLAAHMGKVIEL